jgi:hypothetical protein
MRVFLDACVDPRVVELLAGHEVETAFDRNWHQLKDHILLPLVQEQFDAFVTIDQGFEFEHNLKKLKIGLVIVHVPSNKLESYRDFAKELRMALEAVKPGEVIHVRGGANRQL